MDAIIGDLQKDKAKLAKLTNRQLRAELEAEKATMEARKIKTRFSEKTDALNESTEAHNQDLTRGRKLGHFISQFMPGSHNKNLLEEINKYLALENSRVEDAKKRNAGKSSKGKNTSIPSAKRRPNHRSDEIKKGSLVRLRTGKERGEVIAMQGKTATVMFGSFKTRVKIEKLTFLR
ncbi:MAG TPA: hypothetical protein EYN64_05125 [Flavobacteriales bacterium]|nr:hypothetical protein [Flavobacteriales bacterium]